VQQTDWPKVITEMQGIFANDLKILYRKARELARSRLSQREIISTSELLTACETREIQRTGAQVVLRELAILLGVEPGQLRPRDQLRALFTFDADDLGPGAADVLQKYGLSQLEVCGEDILWMLTKVADTEVWARFRNSLTYRPHNDDEWIDVLMGMTVCQLVNTFGEEVTQ
jgi:hypothetical protein